ncbi:MAG: hypothetical protein L0Z63_11655 [Actinobacteria bacterium]|nr:hypothetical protein [Actinomycetota bacterium]
MMNDQPRRRPGSALIALGIVILALIVASNVLGWRIPGFLEDAILLPIVLIFVGRALNRRGRRAEIPQPSPPQRGIPPFPQERPRSTPPPVESPRPVERTAPIPAERPAPPSAPAEPAIPVSTEPPPTPRPPTTGSRPRSSAEMIEDAKRRLAPKKPQRPKAAD